jgi:type I restriction-modification system DNA methylase subunit
MNYQKKDRRSNLDKEIDSILKKMEETDKLSDEYKKLLAHLDVLYQARGKNYEPRKRISPDTMLLVAANLLGIILILNFEKLDSVTSKAIGFIVKGRA